MKKVNWNYTIGEVLIVIIGITIAFSLNKCSEDSKNSALKSQYLTNLKMDIESDKAQLLINIKELEAKINDAVSILPYLNTDSTNKMQIVGKVFNIIGLSHFSPQDITYQTLINSGDLKLIDNFDLKASIERHYSNYDEMLKSYLRQEAIVKEYIGNYLINHADYDKMPKGEFPFTNEKLLKNIVQSMRGSFLLKINATKDGVASCDTIIGVINKSLNN